MAKEHVKESRRANQSVNQSVNHSVRESQTTLFAQQVIWGGRKEKEKKEKKKFIGNGNFDFFRTTLTGPGHIRPIMQISTRRQPLTPGNALSAVRCPLSTVESTNRRLDSMVVGPALDPLPG